MKRLISIYIFAIAIIFTGCKRIDTPPIYRAVTQVDIITNHENQIVGRHYTAPEKIRPILLYLRILKPTGKPVDINENTSNIFLISITLSDGSKHYYRQAAHQYLSKQGGPWKTIDPEQAAELYSILRHLPSDM